MTQNPARRGIKQSGCGGDALGRAGRPGGAINGALKIKPVGKCQGSSEIGEEESVFSNASIEIAIGRGAR